MSEIPLITSSRRSGPRFAGTRDIRARSRRAMRALAVVLIVAGALALIDAGVTLVWQEPFSALYAKLRQDHLSGALAKVERAAPTPSNERHARRPLATSAGGSPSSRAGWRAARRTAARSGGSVIPRIGASFVVVKGTEHVRSARAAPGSIRKRSSPAWPARRRSPGTARPTSRRSATSTRCAAATGSCSNMPYAHFTYTVDRQTRRRADRRQRGGRQRRLLAARAVGLHAAVQRRQTAARLRAADAHGAGRGRARPRCAAPGRGPGSARRRPAGRAGLGEARGATATARLYQRCSNPSSRT